MIFNENSTLNDKRKALNVLQGWKIRRRQDTNIGILCTLVLLDVSVKDTANEIKDQLTLSTLYGSALTKFINYATSLKLGTNTMYASAHQLGIDSFIIDLRHSFSHGRQTFNLDVYRNSHNICMKWIKEYYWDREIENIQDADIKNIRYDAELEEKLDEIFTFYDILAELILKNFKTFDELENSNEISKERWPLVKEFMKEKNLKNFRQSLTYFTKLLSKIITSREVRLNPKTFFHVMLTKCDLFMRAFEISKDSFIQKDEESSDEEEVEITPLKRPKLSSHESIVNLYQKLIWHVAKNDYLKLFIDLLLQIYLNQSESEIRRKSAHFWIDIILKSYHYYQKYCDAYKSRFMEQKIPPEIKNIYSYQLDADIKNVFIFVGTQMLPTSLKYSNESVLHLLEAINENDNDLNLCLSLIPLIYPPLTIEQIESMKELIDIKLSSSKKVIRNTDEKVYTVRDLQASSSEVVNDNDKIWKHCETEISWSSLPIGYEFKV